MNKKKTFDCVEMKRKIQAKMYEEIRGMTHKEELEYYQRSAKEFLEKDADSQTIRERNYPSCA